MRYHIDITPDLRVAASDYEDNVLGNLPDHPNPTGFEYPGRYYTGRLGELAAMLWLHNHGVRYTDLTNGGDGTSDAGDLTLNNVFQDPVIADVKTTRPSLTPSLRVLPRHLNRGIRNNVAMFILVLYAGNHAWMAGWTDIAHVAKAEPVDLYGNGPVHVIAEKDLLDMMILTQMVSDHDVA